MLLSDIKRRVKNILGDDAGVYIEDVDIIDYANDGQMDIVRNTEILRTTGLISTVAGQAEYALPADFILAKRATYLLSKMSKTTVEEIDSMDLDKDTAGDTGTPQWYYISGNKIGLYPTPVGVVANAIRVTYVKTPTALVNDADIPEIPVHMHEDIVRYVIMRAREQEEDYYLLQSTSSDYTKRLALSSDQANAGESSSYPSVRDIDVGYA